MNRKKGAVSRGAGVGALVAAVVAALIVLFAVFPLIRLSPPGPPPVTTTRTPTTITSTSEFSSSSTTSTSSSSSLTSTNTTTQSSSSGPVYGNVTVYAARVPSRYWAPCFALVCKAGTGPGASMWFDLYNSNLALVQDGFSNENGLNFTGLNPQQAYYVYPQDCDFCHRSNHDVNFSHWGDNSTVRPLEVHVGQSVTAWYKFVPLNCTFVTTTAQSTTTTQTASISSSSTMSGGSSSSTSSSSTTSASSSSSTITCNTGTGIVPVPTGGSNSSANTAIFVVAGVTFVGVAGVVRRGQRKDEPLQ